MTDFNKFTWLQISAMCPVSVSMRDSKAGSGLTVHGGLSVTRHPNGDLEFYHPVFYNGKLTVLSADTGQLPEQEGIRFS